MKDIKCLLGFHDWKYNDFIDMNNRKSSERICRKCFKHQEKHYCKCGKRDKWFKK